MAKGECMIMKHVRYVPKTEAVEAEARLEHIRRKYGMSNSELEKVRSWFEKLWIRELLDDHDAIVQSTGAETVDQFLE
jgi:hypothetical protein